MPLGASAANVFKEDPTSPNWFTYDDSVSLAVTWNTNALGSDVDNVTIEIFSFYEVLGSRTMGLGVITTLVDSVPFSNGRAEFSRPSKASFNDPTNIDNKLLGFITVKELVALPG